MNLLQKLVLAVTPKWLGDSMRRESEEWHVICPKCGRARSVWDMGGIRWKAYSIGKRVLVRCSACDQRVWAKVLRIRKSEEN